MANIKIRMNLFGRIMSLLNIIVMVAAVLLLALQIGFFVGKLSVKKNALRFLRYVFPVNAEEA